MSVDHKAQALAITCGDFRFQEMIDDDLAITLMATFAGIKEL